MIKCFTHRICGYLIQRSFFKGGSSNAILFTEIGDNLFKGGSSNTIIRFLNFANKFCTEKEPVYDFFTFSLFSLIIKLILKYN